MWFTKVSLNNPVFATMVMLAFVVLGLFSFNRLQVDQFPNIDFPVVVITTEYPGASPAIVEAEVRSIRSTRSFTVWESRMVGVSSERPERAMSVSMAA